jgi:hypothetical protein
MNATNDRTGLRAAGWFALIEERDRIAQQAGSICEAIRAMRAVRDQMQDRLIAILGELQRRDALGTGKNDGEAK